MALGPSRSAQTSRVPRLAAALVFSLLSGCPATETPPAAQRPVLPAPGALTPALDLGAVRGKVARAFVKVASDAFVAEDGYRVAVSSGRLSFRAPEQAGPSSELVLQYLGASAGEKALSPVEAEVKASASQVRRSRAAGLTEQIEARPGEIEQSFTLQGPADPDAPAATLRLTQRLSGMSLVAQNASGLHFAPPQEPGQPRKVGARYGQVTVIDARGEKTSLAASFAPGTQELVIEVPGAVLAQATYPVVIDPTLSAEFDVDVPVYIGATGDQTLPAVAFDGTNSLVVWADSRTSRIWGTRVSQAGKVLEPAGFQISDMAANPDSEPAVAYDPTSATYLVVWTRSTGSNKTFGARVRPTGVVQDTTAVNLTSAASSAQSEPALVKNGTSFLLVWTDDRNSVTTGTDIYAGRVGVTPSLAALDGAGFAICTSIGAQANAAVAATSSEALVVWQDSRASAVSLRDVYGARVTASSTTVKDANGTLLSIQAGGLAGTTDQFNPAVGTTGTNFLVAWRDNRGGTTGGDVYGIRAISGASLTLGDAAAFPIISIAGEQDNPAIASDGTDYFIVWSDSRSGFGADIYGARYDTATGTLSPNSTSGTALNTVLLVQSRPALLFDGTNYLAVWQDGRSGTNDIWATRVDKSNAPLDGVGAGFLVSSVANFESNAAAAYNGTNYLVVWADRRNAITGSDIYGALIDPGGAPVGPVIAINTAFGTQDLPRVAWDGVNFVVVWQNGAAGNGDIIAARVTSAGAVTDPTGFTVANGNAVQLRPAIAGGAKAGDTLVVWEDVTDTKGSIVAAGVAGGAFNVSNAAGTQSEPALAAISGSGYFVAWRDTRNAGGGSGDIYGAHLGLTGTVGDGGAGTGVAIVTGAALQRLPAVATDGVGYFVVWEENTPATAPDLAGRTVGGASGGALGATLAIDSSAGIQTLPAVSWDGLNYLLVYQSAGAFGPNLSGIRVSSAAALVDSAPFLVHPSAGLSPALARGLQNQVLVAYHAALTDTVYGTTRVFARLYVPCATASDCNDNNVCTTDSCSVSLGGCQNPANTVACDDGLKCTRNDVCAAKVCSGTLYSCLPGTCQTASACDGLGGCVPTNAANGTTCNDANACTSADVCTAGSCAGTPYSCVLGPCQSNTSCDGAGGCNVTNLADNTACNDGVACTSGEKCTAGVCGGGAVNSCTPTQCEASSSCNGSGGCTKVDKALNTPCDDGDPCTVADKCSGGGACLPGKAYTCTPGPCEQTSVCDGLGGCTVTPKVDGVLCDDGIACTKNDACSAGVCGGLAYVCTAGTCDASSTCNGLGGCTTTAKPDATACNDANPCTFNEKCTAGVCGGGTVYTCAAGTCDLSAACDGTGACTRVAKPDATACNDSNPCTFGEKCTAGTCGGGTAYTCTAGTCDLSAACDGTGACTRVAKPDNTACNDADACTFGEKCTGGACGGGTAYSCSAGQCDTSASCDGAGACTFVRKAPGSACDDLLGCTSPDSCDGAGNCAGVLIPGCGVDAGTPGPDAASPGPDAASAGPDAATAGPDAATAGPDAATARVDAATAGPDAGADAGRDAGLDAGADAATAADAASRADAASAIDSGAPADAASAADVGSADTGITGLADSGFIGDSGVPGSDAAVAAADAGAPPVADAGEEPQEVIDLDGAGAQAGCGCSTGTSALELAWLPAALFLLRRRRTA